MTVSRALRLTVVAPFLIAIMILFAITAALWNGISRLSQFPSWLIAMTVVLTLLACLYLIQAVTSW